LGVLDAKAGDWQTAAISWLLMAVNGLVLMNAR